MRVLGVCCTKDEIDWVVLEGGDPSSAVLVGGAKAKVPQCPSRGEELVWVRKEVHEILDGQQVDEAVVHPAGKGRPGTAVSTGRCEVEGVVQEALADRKVTTTRANSAGIRSAFKAKNNVELESALSALAVLTDVAKSRKGPYVAALSAMSN